MSIEREYGKYVPTCDNCGDFLDPEDSFEEARIALKENDWKTKKVKEGKRLLG